MMKQRPCSAVCWKFRAVRYSQQYGHHRSSRRYVQQSRFADRRWFNSSSHWSSPIAGGTPGPVAVRLTNESYFVQPSPSISNQFEEDAALQSYLKHHLPSEHQPAVFDELRRFGQRVSTELVVLHQECEDHPPRLTQYDAWGKRIDNIWTCSAWKRMHDISASEGLIASGYEGMFGPHSRLFQVAKNYLFSGHSGSYSCPIAMTDGACKIIKAMDQTKVSPFAAAAFNHMTSRDPSEFWTSGQWMTERRGGSDVANGTETTAIPLTDNLNGPYALFGCKWFSSATDADIAFTLARVVDENRRTQPGTSGLSLFYVETRQKDGLLNKMKVLRLKNKLGTRQLPTAELILNGTVAHLMGDVGRGVSSISDMLLITRLHNAIAAVSNMRRIVNLARRYAMRRTAFGKLLVDHALHLRTLTELEVEVRGSLLMLLESARLLGLQECGLASEHQRHLLRIISPLLKLWTGKQAVAVVSEALESFGGQGYIEDTSIPAILRDTQVLPIWEGTTNILSLDVLRSVEKSQGKTVMALLKEIDQLIKSSDTEDGGLDQARDQLRQALREIGPFLAGTDHDALECAARDLALSLARTYIGSLLVQHAASSGQEVDRAVAQRWCSKKLTFLDSDYNLISTKLDKSILMDGIL